MNLAEQDCQACRTDAEAISPDKAAQLLAQLPHWQLLESDAHPLLQRSFAFNNFAHALAFTNKVGEMAEREDHHPALLTEWGNVTVSWWTHSFAGLHLNDFILAARTTELAHAAEGFIP